MSDLKQYLNVYEFTTKLPGSEKEVKYKGLSTNLVKKLLIFENDKDILKEEKMLDFILNEVVISEINIDNMYVLDRYYLFIKIREATKGSLYQYQYTCPECKSQSLQTIDLEKVKILKTKITKKNRELKILNGTITFIMEHPKRGLQKEVYNCIKKKQTDTEKKIEIQLADIVSHITKVTTPNGDHELNYKELIDFVGELPETELDIIRKWQDDYYFGIDLKHTDICKGCGNEEERNIPVSNFFS